MNIVIYTCRDFEFFDSSVLRDTKYLLCCKKTEFLDGCDHVHDGSCNLKTFENNLLRTGTLPLIKENEI